MTYYMTYYTKYKRYDYEDGGGEDGKKKRRKSRKKSGETAGVSTCWSVETFLASATQLVQVSMGVGVGEGEEMDIPCISSRRSIPQHSIL